MNGREEKTSPLRLAWDATMACRADVVPYPERFLLRRHRRVPVSRHGAGSGHHRKGQAQQRPRPLGPDQLMDRLAEVAASKDCRPSTSEP